MSREKFSPKGTIEKYEYNGKFDDGYEAYRYDVLAEMKKRGILPEGIKEPTPLNPLKGKMHGDGETSVEVENKDDVVRPWDQVVEELGGCTEKQLFAKLMEVYAAFSTYTDDQIGRIVEYLKATKQLENTLIIYAADNGASGEGSPNGSVNENKFFNGYPDTPQENLSSVAEIGGLDQLGGPDTYEHYPTGWAVATSTPFKMFKRYSEYAGGTCCPLVMSWPKRIKKDVWGQVRHQYHHCTDIVPTILEACGLEMPEVYKGVKQYPLSGVSMCYTWDAAPDAPTKKVRQYYAMLGTRGIWENGWKAVSLHAPLSGHGDFDQDEWELYHVDEDRSEENLMETDPDKYRKKLQQLIAAWFEEAEKNLVLPLDDRSAVQQLGIERPTEEAPREEYEYYPGASPVPESVAANIRGCSYEIRAEDVVIGIDGENRCEGVIFAHGSRFGGHSLFIQGGKLHYVYNFLGIDEQKLSSTETLAPGTYTFKVTFEWKSSGPNSESVGDTKLYVNNMLKPVAPLEKLKPVATLTGMKAQTGKFTLCGDGLCVGYDSADAISKDYKDRGSYPFQNGTIGRVVIKPEGTRELDHAVLLAGALSAD